MKDLIQQYLTEKKDMQLATIANGQPWICTVYFVHDDDFNLYWMSAREQALQIVGNAYEVSDEELEYAHKLYQGKFGVKDYDLTEIKQHEPTGRAYWVLKPIEISLWDEVNFPNAPKQKHIVGESE